MTSNVLQEETATLYNNHDDSDSLNDFEGNSWEVNDDALSGNFACS